MHCPTGTLDGPSKKLRLGSCVASLLVLVSLAARWIATGAPWARNSPEGRQFTKLRYGPASLRGASGCGMVWPQTGAEKDHVPFFIPFSFFFPKTFSAQCPLGKFWSWCRWHCFEVQVAPAEVYQMCLALHRDTGRRDPTCTVVIPTTRKSMLLVTSYRSKAALGHFVLSATSMQTIQHAKPFRAG